MDTNFDHRSINQFITAISNEMNPSARKPRSECDTLFLGGAAPSDDDQAELAQFGLRKNWKIVFPSFDPSDLQRGPINFHVFVTDGLSEAHVLRDGRLWKQDHRSAAILVFAGLGIVVRFSSKGRLLVRPASRVFHDRGYALAIQSVTANAAREPGHHPVLSSIGRMPVVLDVHTMHNALASA